MDRGTGWRPGVVAALLVLAAAGLRSAGSVGSRGGGQGGTGAATLAPSVVAAVGAALLVVAAAVTFRQLLTRHELPAGAVPGARRRPRLIRQILTLALFAALVLSPAGSWLLRRLGEQIHPQGKPATTAPHNRLLPTGAASRPPTSVLPAAELGAALGAAGLLAAATVRWRRRRSPRPVGEEDEDLAAAVAAAAAALDVDALPTGSIEPRLRVIRCYAAMERVLAASGTPRRPADTPTDLLSRAERTGRLPAGPVAALTEVFRRARFGAEPMTTADVAQATDALHALRHPVGSLR